MISLIFWIAMGGVTQHVIGEELLSARLFRGIKVLRVSKSKDLLTMPQDLHETVMGYLNQIAQQKERRSAKKLAAMAHLLGKYRAELVKEIVIKAYGCEVQYGPFAGMRMLDQVAEGCLVPKLLGTYESELHDLIQECGTRYDCVLNIGCAEGYYAVGLARLFSDLEIYAFDDDPNARKLCCALAERNGVRGRLHIAGEFLHSDFEKFAARRTLVVCDIEGGELELLDLARAPSLEQYDILVEMHDVFKPEISSTLTARFAESHEIQMIHQGARDPAQFSALRTLPQLDQWIAVWEWRAGPTPWAFMRARK